MVRGRRAPTLTLTLTLPPTPTPTLTVTLTRYEGGGLYRHVHLVRASPVHIEQHGLFAYSDLAWGSGCGDGRAGGGGGDGCAVPLSATVRTSAAIFNTGPAGTAVAAIVCVTFTLTGPDGAAAATATAPTLSVGVGATTTAHATLSLASPLLWSAPSPTLYTLTATVRQGACVEAAAAPTAAAIVVDEVSVTHGFRELRFDADAGLFINREHFKVRLTRALTLTPSLTPSPSPTP